MTFISHQLNKTEATFYFVDLPPVQTITWFKGDFIAARPKLEKRMRLMIVENLWLQGRISVSSYLKGTCHLCYTTNSSHRSLNEKILNIEENLEVIDPAVSLISRDMPIDDNIYKILKKSGIFIKNGPKEPIFKVSIIPCFANPHDAFALVVQLSHVAGDGATYYRLLNMLCGISEDAGAIVELIPERIQESSELQILAMGKKEEAHITSWGTILQSLLGVAMNTLIGPLPFQYSFVDPVKMKEAKASYAKEAGLPFVSTNDVLTSWLMKYLGYPYGMMLVNWRNRLEGHTDLHAGNYENLIFYEEDDYASPGLIRRSLEFYKRVVTKEKRFPSWFEIATSRCSCVTDWRTFGQPLEIEGCEEDFHFPLRANRMAHRLPSVYIFRAGRGKIGLYYPQFGVSAPGANAPFILTKRDFEKKSE